MRRRRALTPLVVGLMALAVGGCTGGLDGTGDANAVYGDGTVTQVPPENREDAVNISGETLQGEPIDLADLRGQVVVLNLWGSWCTPCRSEAALLEQASQEIDAAFVGMSFRETSFDNARSHEREFEITYPTIADEGAGVLQLGRYAPKAPPTTYVLDQEGRVAALITGEVTSAGTLEDLVEEVAAEDG